MIVNSVAGNDGVCVTVGDFIGDRDGWIHGDYWETDRELETRKGTQNSAIAECQLMRIDGHIEETTEELISETA